MKKKRNGVYVLVKEPGDKEPRIVRRQLFKLTDVGVMIACAIVALLIWLYVVNINDTDVTRNILVRLEVTGIEQLDEKGLMAYGYESLLSKGVTITVQGSNRDLRKYEDGEYRARLDLGGIDEEGEHDYTVTTDIPGGGVIQLVGIDTPAVTIHAYERAEAPVPLRVYVPQTNNFTWTSEGTNEIMIYGPREMVEKVSYARFSVEGILEESKTYTSGFTLQYFDSNDQEVVSEFARIGYSENSDINVKINIRKEKEIPVVVLISGTSEEIAHKLSINTIKISGEPKEVDKIERYIINIDKDNAHGTQIHTPSAEQFTHESIMLLHESIITIDFSTAVTLPEEEPTAEEEITTEADT